jgi:hypothetical protein
MFSVSDTFHTAGTGATHVPSHVPSDLTTEPDGTHPTLALLLSNPLPKRGDDHQGRGSFLLQVTCTSAMSQEAEQSDLGHYH